MGRSMARWRTGSSCPSAAPTSLAGKSQRRRRWTASKHGGGCGMESATGCGGKRTRQFVVEGDGPLGGWILRAVKLAKTDLGGRGMAEYKTVVPVSRVHARRFKNCNTAEVQCEVKKRKCWPG